MASDTFTVGDLTAVVGDNAAAGTHRAGYNGLWSLTHRTEKESVFVPGVAGFNLEHVFDGETIDAGDARDVFFEPRRAAMTFRKLSATEAELHQPPTPTFHLESWTRFTFREPDAIDVSFRFKAHQHVFRREYLGLFWASYVNAPEDKSLYFRGNRLWQQHCTPAHNVLSTVRHSADKFDLTFNPRHFDCLYKSLSPLRFDEPLFYGHFRGHTLIFLFDRTEGLRFTHSPSGGGTNAAAQTTNPAWDFQYVLPRYEVAKEYELRARVIYRERCSRAEVQKEYEKWKG